MTTYQAWQSLDGSVSFGSVHVIEDMRLKGLLSDTATLLHSFAARTFDEAMTIHYQRMGWPPYKPMGCVNASIGVTCK